ncbi:hypothetical protein ACIA49_18600 [Kribbella sp. NPDC051587]|uniref:hypothetical protein n=1 Tax=Kribbella sp. NPDC051587 TaxID=3364119 RepID=UPI0037A66CA0
MKTADRPLDDDDLAMADLAEITDWTPVGGPDSDDAGPALVRTLVARVTNATGWQPVPLQPREEIDATMASWTFTTKRGSNLVAYDGLVFADTRHSGWVAYEIGPEDLAQAEDGLDAAWPNHLALARKHWGEPDQVADHTDPELLRSLTPAATPARRHIAVWQRPGAQIMLFSDQPTKDPLTRTVSVGYAVYLD